MFDCTALYLIPKDSLETCIHSLMRLMQGVGHICEDLQFALNSPLQPHCHGGSFQDFGLVQFWS